MENTLSQFLNPSAAFRGKPFWSWNGELSEAELLRQVHVFKEMGFGGFFMHSRTGLVTEYLGDEWFRLTNSCADEAAKLGLEAWLYDEDRWPSGTAGGLVTERPEFRQQFISCNRHAIAEACKVLANDKCDLVAAFVGYIDGLSIRGARRLKIGEVPSDPNLTLLTFRIETAAESSFYNGNTYVDTMSRDATDAYLDLTHEQYRQRCGNRMGKTIQGIFTDEPHRGPVMNGFSLSNANRAWMTPWTGTLAGEFTEAFGYDLIDHLPSLFFQPEGRVVDPVKWHYMELLQRLFLQNFAKPMFDWCNQHGMLLTGHVLHEDSLTAQTCMQGSLARFYEYMHVPGIDILGEHNRCFWAAKQLSSVARQLGQKWLLSELYGCTGWQMGFDGHKAVGDWQALFGINFRCHHLAWYTMEGEAKRDYPASISYQSAWWKDYKFVEDYFARMGVLLSFGQPCAGLLVINPIESVWCQVHGGWAESLAPTDAAVRDLENKYQELFHWLAGSQIEFDYGDEEMLSRMGRVGRDANGRPVLHFGQATYSSVLVGGMTTIRSSTLRMLEGFIQAGGTVVFAGDTPRYVDAVPSTLAADCSAKATAVAWDRAPIVQAVNSSSLMQIEVRKRDGSVADDVFCQLRRDDSGNTIAVLLNSDRDNPIPSARVRLVGVSAGVELAEWDCASGQRFAVVPDERDQGVVEWDVDLARSGSRAYVIGPRAATGLQRRPKNITHRRHLLSKPMRFELTEPNVCVLDMAEFQIDDEAWQPRAEILKIDRAVRSHFGLKWRSGDMVQPWFRQRQQASIPVQGRVRLRFQFIVDQVPKTAVSLAIEQPARFSVSINRRPISTSGETGWWIDHAIRTVELPADTLQIGRNVVELETDFDESINFEAIYLLGEFGVQVRGADLAIATLPTHLEAGDVVSQGLPFYGGGIRYQLPLPSTDVSRHREGRLLLELPELSAACAKVTCDSLDPVIIAWHPRRVDVTDHVDNSSLWLEVLLTRRNTFGPLHQRPLNTEFYGPENFVTNDGKWSDPFVLYPSGLLAAPVLIEVDVIRPAAASLDHVIKSPLRLPRRMSRIR